MTATLRRTLDLIEGGPGPAGALYIPAEPIGPGGPGILEIKLSEYEDLGRPETITVTIESGDRLTNAVDLARAKGAELTECPKTRFPDGTRCGEYGWHGIGCPDRPAELPE